MKSNDNSEPIANGESDVRKCVEVLERLVLDGQRLAELSPELRLALTTAAGRLSRPSRLEMRLRNRQVDRAKRQKKVLADRHTRKTTGIREMRRQTIFTAPQQQLVVPDREQGVLKSSRNCYVCKAEFTQLHFFYDAMCLPCAEFNYAKRFQRAPLIDQVALITGARLKIGFQAALMMLRAGARVIVTTRFPVDAARRFSQLNDFAQWSDRLDIYGLDLRHTPSVEIFARFIEQTVPRLDILINNAAQTVRRPPDFYSHLMEYESTPWEELPAAVRPLLDSHRQCRERLQGSVTAGSELPVFSWNCGHGSAIGLRASARLSQIPYAFEEATACEELFPRGRLDADLQQVDLRQTNSWRLNLTDVPAPEMLEVQLVNSVAPFILCSRLTSLMRKQRTGQKHIVNVSAMEGKFSRYTKTERHPHTNMAKAALNMLTHTSARELIKDGIHMNAVDTGWVTDEDPAALSLRKQDNHDFQPPLDIVDGAARICDPFFHGLLTGHHWSGKFLKDYFPTEW